MTATGSPQHSAVRTPRTTLWTRANRLPTVGLVLVVTLVAFEFIGVATAMPTLVADLHGGRFYVWPFAAFTAASAVGTVLGGRIGDRRGPGPPIIAATLLFATGLLIAGTAHAMVVLLVGRVVQGFGAGAAVNAVYLLIALVYPERDRPAASALISAAWVMPALLGPPVAGLVTQQVGWRWVFLGLLPLVAIEVPLLLSVIRRLPAHRRDTTTPARRGLLPAAFGAAIGVSLFTFGAQNFSAWTVPLLVGGLVLLVVALRWLLPRGTVRAATGLPSVVLCRGLLAGSFSAAEAFIPLALTAVHGFTPATAGLPLTVAALGWAAGSAWQGRRTNLSSGTILTTGFVLSAAGIAMVTLVDWAWAPGWLALPAWLVAGTGMGIGVSCIAVLLLNLSPPAERGFNTSAMQLSDTIGSVLFIGIGGVLINTLGSTERPSVPLFVFGILMCGTAAFGAVIPARRAAGRLR